MDEVLGWYESDGELPSPESAGGVTEYTPNSTPDWVWNCRIFKHEHAWYVDLVEQDAEGNEAREWEEGPFETCWAAAEEAERLMESGPPVEVEVRTYKDWHPSELHAAIDDRNQCLQAVVPDLEATEEEHPSSWASLVLDRIRGLEMPT